ncbi:MAG: hypothetical protein MJZ17_05275 [Bacteroidales bacterium]|nr:hypothetical protein [Bacteroidales bacterium]
MTDNKNNEEELPIEEAGEVTITAEEVKAAIEGVEALEEKQEKSADAKLADMGAVVEGSVDKGAARVSLMSDTSFDSDTSADIISELDVTVRASQIPITEYDKIAYLKAVLQDVNFELDIPVAAGKVVVTFRSLSAYETDLIPAAMAIYAEDHPDTMTILLAAFRQQCHLAMAMTAFNGKPRDFASYRPGEHTIEEDARDLFEKSLNIVSFAGPKFSLCVAAAEVFVHKVTRLGEAALNKDFWEPASAAL